MTDPAADPTAPAQTFSIRRTAILLATCWYAALFVLFPLKLSLTLSSIYEGGNFPLSTVEWIIALWPPWLATGLVGVSLLASCLYAPPLALAAWRRTRHVWLPWLLLALAAIPGLIVSSERQEARLLYEYLLALALIAPAVLLHVRAWPRSRYILLGAVALGGILIGLYGWYQQFYGLAEFRRQMEALVQQQNLELDPKLLHRIENPRIYATFAGPNNYAAHLILIIPLLTFWPILAWIRRRQDYEPAAFYLGSIGAAALTGLALLWTQSRGGILGLGMAVNLGVLLAVILLARRYPAWRLRLYFGLGVYILAGLLMAGVVYWKVQHGRSLDSLDYRLEYWRAGIHMLREHPATGVGLGEYMNYLLVTKADWLDDEEARLPHNFVIFFLSMTGIAGGIAALYLLLQPIILSIQILRGRLPTVSQPLAILVLVGVLAWLLHALLDFNLVNPGTAFTVALLPALLVDDSALPAADSPLVGSVSTVILGLAGLALALLTLQRIPGESRYQILAHELAKRNPNAAVYAPLFNDIVTLQPDNPNPWFIIARDAQRRQDHTTAITYTQKAIALCPHRAKYYAVLAASLQAAGRHAEARDAIRRCIDWYPTKDKYIQQYIDITGEMPAGIPTPVPGHDGIGPTAPIPSWELGRPAPAAASDP